MLPYLNSPFLSVLCAGILTLEFLMQMFQEGDWSKCINISGSFRGGGWSRSRCSLSRRVESLDSGERQEGLGVGQHGWSGLTVQGSLVPWAGDVVIRECRPLFLWGRETHIYWTSILGLGFSNVISGTTQWDQYYLFLILLKEDTEAQRGTVMGLSHTAGKEMSPDSFITWSRSTWSKIVARVESSALGLGKLSGFSSSNLLLWWARKQKARRDLSRDLP